MSQQIFVRGNLGIFDRTFDPWTETDVFLEENGYELRRDVFVRVDTAGQIVVLTFYPVDFRP